MWGLISTIFLGIYFLMGLYIGRRGWLSLGKYTTGVYQKLYWVLLGLLLLSFPLAEIGGEFLPGKGGFWLTMWGWYTMIAVVYLFLIILFIDIFRQIEGRINFFPKVIKDHQKTPQALGFLVIVLVILTLGYGSWNARNPIVTRYELTVKKKAASLQQLRIAMVSDIHFGEIIDAARLRKLTEIMQGLQPDVILIAGDIIEGNPDPAEAKKFIDIIGKMNAKYGIYAVPGNHDRWARSDSELFRNLNKAGIRVLKDQAIKVENSFYIIGRDDPGHGRELKRMDLPNLMAGVDTSLPLILLDHQPIDLAGAQQSQVDLQLSGHTHLGQIFPSNFITGQIYELDWGLLRKGNYHLVVSSGYGTWGPPLRIGNQPEVVYTIINFKGEKN